MGPLIIKKKRNLNTADQLAMMLSAWLESLSLLSNSPPLDSRRCKCKLHIHGLQLTWNTVGHTCFSKKEKIMTNQTQKRRRQWHPTPVLLPGKSHGWRVLQPSRTLHPWDFPVLLPGKSHGWRVLLGCSPWGCSELDRTERLHFHFSPSCIGEGNGNPLRYSCLENPRDRGAWWAAVYGVAQSRTWLKRLSKLKKKKKNN